MQIGSSSASLISKYLAPDTSAADAGPAATTATPTVSDHVAAVDEQAPIRSVSTTQGTLVDTYL
ncbi:hypothetical protein [Winogradskya humida]|uniref:Uncharacterized protein n=1 Tax=Winogradskya humida TaxID=113566 RepID=A0ABQ3ZUN6_9ACTN|nr:hypothetical protein [Actinoplanes humidus]GIE22315.1 hypothetical protein Ahu01nite_054170 [Actinoplanes humidus]